MDDFRSPDQSRPEPADEGIETIEIEVRELEPAINVFTEVLGFRLVARRYIAGATTGALTAVVEQGRIRFLLRQGAEPDFGQVDDPRRRRS